MLKVGTRASDLALAQTEIFTARVKEVLGDRVQMEVVKIQTSGDQAKNLNLAEIGGKGLFLKELEEQLLAGSIDVAVHCMKDVPAFFNERLMIGCYLPREDPRDGFISEHYDRIDLVPKGAKIATSSIRRHYQLQNIGLATELIRGNVPTRLKKKGGFAGMILAVAGVKRLGLQAHIKEILPTSQFLPAIGQGVICVQARKEDESIVEILSSISDSNTEICMKAERAALQAINGDCLTPCAGLATLRSSQAELDITCMLVKAGKMFFASNSGPVAEADIIGEATGKQLLNA